MMASVLSFVVSTVARAAILLAFSEYIFLNEDPVRHLVLGESPAQGARLLLEMLLLYCLSGALLVVLEPMMTTWPRVILGGSFVGWSIEAAMVPAAYEAIPLSYFWTSVAWHAVIDVAIGCVLVRRCLAYGTRRQMILLGAGLGVFWAVWATWARQELILSQSEFAILALCVLALCVLGYGLSALPVTHHPCGRWTKMMTIGVNLAFWGIWASLMPVAAAGLAVLAGITAWLLNRAAHGTGGLTDGLTHGFARLVWLMCGTGAVAWTGYMIQLEAGPLLSVDTLVATTALTGLCVYIWAAVSAVMRSRHRVSTPKTP